MPTRRTPSLTIGDVAAFAGVTVRAIRHYHERGLLREPPRDASGYRRYDASAVVELIRIKTLSQAGVPLARVRDLLEADSDEFAQALAEIDTALGEEIRRLEEHRRAVAQLASVDTLALPGEAVDYLGRLRAHGLSERIVAIERDQWLLISAHVPDHVRTWITQKAAMLDDNRFVDVYRGFDQAFDWEPGDPRLERLADDLLALFGQQDEQVGRDPGARIDGTVVAMLEAQTVGASPGWRHLAVLLEQRAFPRYREGGDID